MIYASTHKIGVVLPVLDSTLGGIQYIFANFSDFVGVDPLTSGQSFGGRPLGRAHAFLVGAVVFCALVPFIPSVIDLGLPCALLPLS